MNEFQTFAEEQFLKPEKPFLLIYSDEEDINYAWLETEEELLRVVDEIKTYGCNIIDAIEIGSYREIKVEKMAK